MCLCLKKVTQKASGKERKIKCQCEGSDTEIDIYKIRPDFVAAKKKGKDEFEIHYIIESKGEHLSGNPDTQYKKSVLELMTKQQKEKKIYAFQEKLPFGQISEAAEFYLVEQGKEEQTLRSLMK